MTETTTIAITDAQKARLDDLKQGSKESYKDVLQRLIDGHSEPQSIDEAAVRDIVRDMVVYEALE